MSGPAVISYAQAAKGESPSSSTTQSGVQVPSATKETSQATLDPSTAQSRSTVSTDEDLNDVKQNVASATALGRQDDDLTEPIRKSSSGTSSPGRPVSEKRESEVDVASVATGTNSSTTKVDSDLDTISQDLALRSKKGKQAEQAVSDYDLPADSESVKDSNTKPSELSEAPIPAVNVWQQRREAHQALRTKAVPNPSKPTKQGNLSDRTVRQPAGDNYPKSMGDQKHSKVSTNVEVPVVKTQTQTQTQTQTHTQNQNQNQKKGDTARPESEVPKRNGPRGAKPAAEDSAVSATASTPPSVNDESLWPTPETAIKENKRKQDKTDRPEKEGAGDDLTQKGRKNHRWIKVRHVPSVLWETPMPPRGGARGGRLSTRGGRAHQNNTGSSPSSSEKTPSSSAAAKAHASGANETREVEDIRENGEEGALAGAASQPSAPSHRHSPDIHSSRGGRKPSVSTTDRPRDAPHNQVTQHHNHRERGDGRNDRGRGGGRSRGGHHATNSQTQGQVQSSLSPLSNGAEYKQQNAPPNRPPPQYSPQTKQSGFIPSHAPQQSTRARGNNRSNGNPGGMHHHGQPQTSRQIHRMSMPSSSFGYAHAPPAMPMAFPQGPVLEWNTICLIKEQIDYYFSIDNLCKDIFLRRNMDSQGFVLLSVVAKFKRMMNFTDNLNLVRLACEESIEIDYVVGDDGDERIRRRHGWDKWVLKDMTAREESARNNGPTIIYPRVRDVFTPFLPGGVLGPGFITMPSTTYYANGAGAAHRSNSLDELAHRHLLNDDSQKDAGLDTGDNQKDAVLDTPLSAAVPDFSPQGFIGAVGPVAAIPNFGFSASLTGYGKLNNGITSDSSGTKINGHGPTPSSSSASNSPQLTNGIYDGLSDTIADNNSTAGHRP